MNLPLLAVSFADVWLEVAGTYDPMAGRSSLRDGIAQLRRENRGLYDEFMSLTDDDRRRILLFVSMLVKLEGNSQK